MFIGFAEQVEALVDTEGKSIITESPERLASTLVAGAVDSRPRSTVLNTPNGRTAVCTQCQFQRGVLPQRHSYGRVVIANQCTGYNSEL